jgi:hypothetical protein
MAAIVATTASRAYGQQVLNEAALGRLEQRIRDSTLYQRDEELDAELMRQLDGGAEEEDAADYDEDELRDVPLCTETQLTFTLPPAPDDLSYFVRYRVLVDGAEKQEWTDPLQYQGGIFFSPQLKGHKAKTQLAPPVILDHTWEKRHIEPMWRWQSQIHRPENHKAEARQNSLLHSVTFACTRRGTFTKTGSGRR